MNWAAISAGIAIIALLWRLLGRPRRRPKGTRESYARRSFLLSAAEFRAFQALREAVGAEFEIFCRVPLAAVVYRRGNGRPGEPETEAMRACFNFLLCRRTDLGIAAAVCLEGSGDPVDPPPDCAGLSSLCRTVGLPLIVLDERATEDPLALRTTIINSTRRDPLLLGEFDGRKEPGFAGIDQLEL